MKTKTIIFEDNNKNILTICRGEPNISGYMDDNFPLGYTCREISDEEYLKIVGRPKHGPNYSKVKTDKQKLDEITESHDALIDIIGDELNEIRRQAKSDPINIRQKISEKLKR